MNGIDEIRVAYQPVLDFWFTELTPQQWFRGGEELDRLMQQRFTPLLQQAERGELDSWAAVPRGCLALILLLDQFTRNIHRGQPQAFVQDPKAQRLVLDGIAQGWDKLLNMGERQFFYMPLMHAEDRALQKLSLQKFRELRDYADNILQFAKDHAAIVDQFGRYPHRNRVLGRENTGPEQEFLANDGNRYG